MPNDFRRKIIVIDDNTAIHADFRKILGSPEKRAADDELNSLEAALFGDGTPVKRRLEYDIAAASQGQEGLALVQQAFHAGDSIQVAFVDIRMPPGWDGIETIEHLWKTDPDLQTVICSAYSDYSWDAIHARLGDSDRLLILKKPFDTAEICQLAAALTEKYRLTQAARFRVEELDRMVVQRTRELQRINEQLLLEVQQRRGMEERLRHDVLHDRLTGLPNRAMLMDRVEQCIHRQKRDPRYHYALLFMDMDNFKLVNDSLGHEAGDKLLVGIGQRLSQGARSLDVAGRLCEDVTSRLGGDEFVLLLDGLAAQDDALLVARRIETIMAEPFNIDGHEVVANLSIGIAVGRADYDRAADVLRDADTAVYRAKGLGKHGMAVFDAAMHNQVRERLELETDLRSAIGTEQITLAYQPLISLATGHILGFEALARWRHPHLQMIEPGRFIPVAEATGLIVPLGIDLLRLACRQIRQFRQLYAQHPVYRDLWVAVNLSNRQLHMKDLPDSIDAVVRATGIDPSAIRLEITESVVMEHGDVVIESLKRLRAKNYLLSLDDFGTGYSSLSHLHRMPVNEIKIDQSFVRKLGVQGRPFSATIHAIVNLAHNCGIQVVGEGVENLDQLVQLQALDCDAAQGFWFTPPVAPAQAARLLNDNLDPGLWRQRIEQLANANPRALVRVSA